MAMYPAVTNQDLLQWRNALAPTESIGFVPTMGALHAGHRALIETARKNHQRVVVSIFVNPKQFGPSEDFAKYPRTLEADLQLCAQAGADCVFMPTTKELYAENFNTYVINRTADTLLCGKSRPGHFEGVLTVVMLLLNLVRPTAAYFGKKDYQQLWLINRMANDLHLPYTIKACETIREPDGLAMSSRNRYLDNEQRPIAAQLYAGLKAAMDKFKSGEIRSKSLLDAAEAIWQEYKDAGKLRFEYAEIRSAEDLSLLSGDQAINRNAVFFVAARLGSTRLIDNLEFSI